MPVMWPKVIDNYSGNPSRRVSCLPGFPEEDKANVCDLAIASLSCNLERVRRVQRLFCLPSLLPVEETVPEPSLKSWKQAYARTWKTGR